MKYKGLSKVMLIPLLFGIINFIISLKLVISSNSIDKIGYFVLFILSIINVLIGIYEALLFFKKQKLYDRAYESIMVIYEFNQKVKVALAHNDVLEYQRLFLKRELSDEEKSDGKEAILALSLFIKNNSNMFYHFYKEPILIDSFLEICYSMLNNLAEPFKSVPVNFYNIMELKR